MSDLAPDPGAPRHADMLNALLRGELSAVESYDRAMQKLEDQRILADLQRIRAEHEHAVQVLRITVASQGGEPSGCTGPWGAAATVIRGMAHALGPATVLSALRQGEEHAINEYERALADEDINPVCRSAIRAELLPFCRQHVDELNRLMGGMT